MKTKNYPTLKEVFIPEAPQNSQFVASMRKQLGRAQDQESLDYIADVYDRILALLQEPSQQRQQQVLAAEQPLFKFHYRIAYKEFQNGSLDPKAATSGKDMLTQELEKRNVDLASSTSSPKPIISQDPANAERTAAYGGNLNDPRGLGT